MNEWNVIESSWCITTLRKRILWAHIALNCPEFHFLIKASDLLAGSWLEAYEVCPVDQERKGMAGCPGACPEVPGLRPLQPQPRQGADTASAVRVPRKTYPLPTPRCPRLPNTCVRGTHHHGVQIPARTHSHQTSLSLGTLAFCAAVLRSMFMLGTPPVLSD